MRYYESDDVGWRREEVKETLIVHAQPQSGNVLLPPEARPTTQDNNEPVRRMEESFCRFGGLHLVRLVLFVDVQALAVCVYVGSVNVVRNELAAVARRGDWRRVLVEEIDLLERQTLGLEE